MLYWRHCLTVSVPVLRIDGCGDLCGRVRSGREECVRYTVVKSKYIKERHKLELVVASSTIVI